MLKVVVSGSFHRHMREIYEAVGEMRAMGFDVLSPSDPRVVDHIGDFLFVASDRMRAIKTVQRRHFEAIRRCDLLWIASPDGYTGESTSGEIGAAIVLGKPVFASVAPLNTTWREFVGTAASIAHAAATVEASGTHQSGADMTLDPESALSSIAAASERCRDILVGRRPVRAQEAEARLTRDAAIIAGAVNSLRR